MTKPNIFYTLWHADGGDGWYCATVYADGSPESMAKGWGDSDYVGPCATSAEALRDAMQDEADDTRPEKILNSRATEQRIVDLRAARHARAVEDANEETLRLDEANEWRPDRLEEVAWAAAFRDAHAFIQRYDSTPGMTLDETVAGVSAIIRGGIRWSVGKKYRVLALRFIEDGILNQAGDIAVPGTRFAERKD